MLQITKEAAMKIIAACNEATDTQDGYLHNCPDDLLELAGDMEDHLYAAHILGVESCIILSNTQIEKLSNLRGWIDG